MRLRSQILLSTMLLWQLCFAQPFTTKISSLEGEKWWGGLTALGSKMPFSPTFEMYDLSKTNLNNQIVPLMLSSAGRYIWSDRAFQFSLSNDTVVIVSDYEKPELAQAGSNLRDAYLGASSKHFPPSGKIPEEIFFSKPQYNTWIELMYDQNQEDVLDYAQKILDNNYPIGIFMIDDNWQKYYGNFEFKPDRFPDAKAMNDKLHQMGFKVMVWICPFVSADSPEYRELNQKGFLLKDKTTNSPAIIKWWNGASACYDLTNPAAATHLKQLLRDAQTRYGIDGYKFDAGDVSYMRGSYAFFDKDADINLFCQRWAEMGLEFPYNELRTSWKLGGKELVQRLGDKGYSWGASSLLIPDMVTAGLLGHLYTCPDMIGGGAFTTFLNLDPAKFNQELIVRSCQIHTLMPMMQFSVAPWRILSKENNEICSKFARLHESMGSYILETARNASKTGEPIVRHMEYAYPHQGFIDCKDQYMLGDKYLVAPMVKSGTSRTVRLPKDKWRDDRGKTFKGPKTIEIDVPLDRLPYYEKL